MQAEEFFDQGLLVMKDVVDRETLAALQAYADELTSHHLAGKDSSDGDQFYAIGGLLNDFKVPKALWIEEVGDLLIDIFRPAGITHNRTKARLVPFKAAFAALRVSLPGDTNMRIHTDTTHLFDGAFGHLPPTCVFVQIPLCEFTSENGGTMVVPGSHKLREAPQPDGDDPAAWRNRHVVNVEPGDIFLMDSRIWHAAGANHTNEVRRMFTIGFEAEWFDLAYKEIGGSTYDQIPGMGCLTVDRGPDKALDQPVKVMR